MNTTEFFTMPHGTFQDTGLQAQLQQQFIASQTCDLFLGRVSFALVRTSGGIRDAVMSIKGIFTDARVVMPRDVTEVAIFGSYRGPHGLYDVFIWMTVYEYGEAYKFKVDVTSDVVVNAEIVSATSSLFENSQLPLIRWWFSGRHGDETKDFYLPPDTVKLLPEYYPDLGDPEAYLNEYMRLSESILLLAGPPGTGKTTLIRYMINKFRLTAHVIYDERLMEKDGPFQSFLFGESDRPAMNWGYDEESIIATTSGVGANVLVIEDADTLLTSRERDSNKLMARFLNVADGLIKLPNKKLVFTTNITDFGKVDTALLRPGRCFGVLHMRLLNLQEAQLAAAAGGMIPPTEKREYSLAELFNNGRTATIRKIGF